MSVNRRFFIVFFGRIIGVGITATCHGPFSEWVFILVFFVLNMNRPLNKMITGDVSSIFLSIYLGYFGIYGL